MFNPTREQVRRFFCDAWRKHKERLPLQPSEVVAAELVAAHPEYHALMDDVDTAIEQEFTPEGGKMNPFLHLSLHLAVAEQISIDQPPGIKSAYERLREKFNVDDAEHTIMDCLGETIWHAQRNGGGLNSALYLECIRKKL